MAAQEKDPQIFHLEHGKGPGGSGQTAENLRMADIGDFGGMEAFLMDRPGNDGSHRPGKAKGSGLLNIGEGSGAAGGGNAALCELFRGQRQIDQVDDAGAVKPFCRAGHRVQPKAGAGGGQDPAVPHHKAAGKAIEGR